jgi:hypothetical protein
MDWKPHPRQEVALRRREFEVLYGGARGGGKTDAGLVWLTWDTENPKYRALVIRKNADDLSDWLDRANVMYNGQGVEIIGKPAIIKFPSGAVIRTGHLKDDQAYTKYQGHEYHRMLIEELTQIPDVERYLKLISSCRSTVPGLKAQIFATCNPGGIGHAWVKERFVDEGKWGEPFKDDKTGRTRIFIPAKVDDNPTLMTNDPSYVDFLNGLPDNLRKAWRDGDWDVFAGQFFPEFIRDVHVIRPIEIPSSWRRVRGLDYGYTAPSACIWGAVDYDDNIYIYRELLQTGLTYEMLANRIMEMTSEDEEVEYTAADTEMFAKTRDTGEYGHDIMADTGVPISQANKERIPGWNLLRERFRRNKLFIFDTCTQLIKDIPAAVHDERKVEDLDTTGSDHTLDAIRYLLMSLPQASIEERRPEVPNLYENDPHAPWNKKSTGGYKNHYSYH